GAVISERFSKVQPLFQIIPGANVIGGKNISPAETAQQCVLGGPTPYSTELQQTREGRVIGCIFQGCGLKSAIANRPCQFDQGTRFVVAVTKRQQILRFEQTQVFRLRKRVTVTQFVSIAFDQTVQQDDSHREA